MSRTSGKKFFQLSLWYFLKIFEFHNERLHWQARSSHSPPNLEFLSLLNVFSFLVWTSRIFLSLLTRPARLLALLVLFTSTSVLTSVFIFSFDAMRPFLCFFLGLLSPLVSLPGLFVPRAFSWPPRSLPRPPSAPLPSPSRPLAPLPLPKGP